MSTNAKASPAKPSQAKYNAAVRACKTAAGQLNKANWVIGDAALTVETTYGKGTVQRFADDIAVNYRTVLDLRFVAGAYPVSDRSESVSWTVHQVFSRLANRTTLIAERDWSVSEARAYVKSLNDSDELGSDELGDNELSGGEPVPALSPLEQARANVTRLQNELSNALLKLARLEAETEESAPAKSAPAKSAPAKPAPAKSAPAKSAPAKSAPAKSASDQHVVKGLPQHRASDYNAACPLCVKSAKSDASVTQISKPRNARRAA